MQKENRLISALSGFGIFLVVVGHGQAGPKADDIAAPGHDFYVAYCEVVRFIYTFHMPLFFMISGYLLLHASLRGGTRPYPAYGEFLQSKAKRLLAPYLLISSLTFPIKVVLSSQAARPVSFSLGDYLETLFLPWNNTIIFFWFLPTLFLMFALAPLLLRPQRHWTLDALLLIGGVACWFIFPNRHDAGLLAIANIGGLLHNLVFFTLGFMLCKYGAERWALRLHPAWMLSGVLAWLIYLQWGTVLWVNFALALLGMIFSAAVCRSLPRVFAGLGDHSFDIYLFSWFPQIAVRVILGQLLTVHAAVVVVTSVLCGLLVPVFVAHLKRRAVPERLQFLVGG